VAAVRSAPPHARNRIAIETFVRELTDDPRAARFTLMEASGSEALTRRRRAMVRSAVETALDQKRSRNHGRRSQTYREVALTVLIGGLIELLVAWKQGVIDSDLPHLVDQYVQLVNEVSGHRSGSVSTPERQ